eukprot:11893557-Ditylum_brightwellii.AAC.2
MEHHRPSVMACDDPRFRIVRITECALMFIRPRGIMMTPGLSKTETTTILTNASLMEVTKKALTELGKGAIVEAEDLAEFDKAT